jgi:hypothetical protein
MYWNFRVFVVRFNGKSQDYRRISIFLDRTCATTLGSQWTTVMGSLGRRLE